MLSSKIKAVILCGGRGTRLGEITDKIPKPLVKIDGKPILWHIMRIYSHYNINNFVLCLGYKGQMIKDYFSSMDDWNITFAETGLNTGTAARVLKIKEHIDDQFFLTYGDGIADVDISKLLHFHDSHGKIGTVTAVRPLVRFGMLDLDGSRVSSFSKYSIPSQGWIDGGFFVFNRNIFNYLRSIDKNEMLEGKTLENLSHDEELMAFRHEGYWKCIDTNRDLLSVTKDIETGNDKWRVWK